MRADLPAAAAARMAALRSSGTWGSALTADEFAAVRSVAFEPVGQVFGAAVYGGGGSATGYSCPGPPRPGAASSPPGPATQATQAPGAAQATEVSGLGNPGSFAPLVRTLQQARHTAVGRMIAECAELGGHGVVGVRLSRGEFLLGGTQFTVIGTAVRARDTAQDAAQGTAQGTAPSPPPPFTSDLSGQDFAKLIMAGWVPVGLVLGISIGSRHDDRATTRQARWTSGNAEVAGWTDLVTQSRQDARRQLEGDVSRLGAEGAVIASMRLRVRQRDCPAVVSRHDHIVEATVTGTAVARFSRAGDGRRNRSALSVMPLDPQRRQAARIRI